MKLGILAELPGSSFLPRLKSELKTGIYRALLTWIPKCLSGRLEGLGFLSQVCLGRDVAAFHC